MKKNIFALAALLIASAAVFTACSSDDNIISEQQPAQGVKTYTMTVQASKGDGGTTRGLSLDGKTLNVKWNEGEEVTVVDFWRDAVIGTLYSAASDNGSTTLTGTVTIDDSFDGSSGLAFYLHGTRLDFTGQKGVLLGDANSIESKYDYAWGLVEEGNYEISGDEISVPGGVEFDEPLTSIIKFTLQDTDGNPINATSLTLHDRSEDFDIYLIENMLDGDDYEEGDLVVEPAEPTSEIYVAIEGDQYDIALTAIDEDGNTYTYEKDGATFGLGKYYEITVKMTKQAAYTLLSAATTADYGKVVCAAGHLHDAKTAVPAGCTAVGIVGKVTETGHGLILALQDATSQTWNTINGWTSTIAYAGTTLKLLPDDARGSNLTSYTTLGSTTVSNWAVAQKSDYEAIFTNLGSTTGDSDGKTYDSNVNAYITGVGGTAITGLYWSATESNVNYAWYFGSYYWGNVKKTLSNSVRSVLAF